MAGARGVIPEEYRLGVEHGERIKVAIATALGLDPERITSFSIESDGELAYIAWEGKATLPAQQVVDIINEVESP